MNRLMEQKFVVTIGCGIVTSLLCWFDKIGGEVYATVIIATVGAFIAGEVTQHIKGNPNAES